jgi:hypothetical protein
MNTSVYTSIKSITVSLDKVDEVVSIYKAQGYKVTVYYNQHTATIYIGSK